MRRCRYGGLRAASGRGGDLEAAAAGSDTMAPHRTVLLDQRRLMRRPGDHLGLSLERPVPAVDFIKEPVAALEALETDTLELVLIGGTISRMKCDVLLEVGNVQMLGDGAIRSLRDLGMNNTSILWAEVSLCDDATDAVATVAEGTIPFEIAVYVQNVSAAPVLTQLCGPGASAHSKTLSSMNARFRELSKIYEDYIDKESLINIEGCALSEASIDELLLTLLPDDRSMLAIALTEIHIWLPWVIIAAVCFKLTTDWMAEMFANSEVIPRRPARPTKSGEKPRTSTPKQEPHTPMRGAGSQGKPRRIDLDDSFDLEDLQSLT